MSYNILVTGGAGYLDSVLVLKLLQLGHKVTVLDNFIFGQNSLLDCCHYNTFEVILGDARDRALIKRALIASIPIGRFYSLEKDLSPT